MGDAPKGVLEYQEMLPGGAATKDILELKGLMSDQPIARKGGPIGCRILKLLINGGQQMPETQVKIEITREESGEFVRKQQEGSKPTKKITLKARKKLRALSMG